MRGRAQRVYNPRTDGQMELHSKFSNTLNIFQPISAYIRVDYKTYANKQTAFNTDKGETVFSTAATIRADKPTELNLPVDWNGDTIKLYIGFASADGINVANLIYLENHTGT